MKRRRVEQTERRRPLVEMNLVGEAKTRSAAASRGCAALLGRVLGGVLVAMTVWQGLS